ncbi:hypothetical protein TrVE_jg13381 [Triparma verrucosa]|uniref:Uncharacterized protein n=1 Tax=Triparma verrucosa TaxID=1606542 RepID=A0A9W7CE18_9STRA|nr:hypothetical protein TrVE_jg13381 [Triparma verrucosa]
MSFHQTLFLLFVTLLPLVVPFSEAFSLPIPPSSNSNSIAYLQSLGISSSSISSLPHLPPPSDLLPTVDYLKNLYGLKEMVKAVEMNPSLLLTRGLGDVKCRPLSPLLRARGFTEKEIENIHSKYPQILGLTNSSQCEYVISYLRSIVGVADGGAKAVCKVVTRHPWILGLKTSNLELTHIFLTEDLGLGEKTMRVIVTRFLPIYGLSLNGNVRESVEKIRAALGLEAGEFRKVMERHPGIVLLKEENFNEKVEYFEAAMGLGAAKKIVLNCPSVFSLSLSKTLIPRVEYLKSVWPDDIEFSKRVNEYPALMSLSVENNVRPTLDWFYKNGYEVDDIRGRYLAASLYKRIVPRWLFWKEVDGEVRDLEGVLSGFGDDDNDDDNDRRDGKEVVEGWKEDGKEGRKGRGREGRRKMKGGNPPLNVLTTASDLKFCEWIGVQGNRFNSWKEGDGGTRCDNEIFIMKLGLMVETGRKII